MLLLTTYYTEEEAEKKKQKNEEEEGWKEEEEEEEEERRIEGRIWKERGEHSAIIITKKKDRKTNGCIERREPGLKIDEEASRAITGRGERKEA